MKNLESARFKEIEASKNDLLNAKEVKLSVLQNMVKFYKRMDDRLSPIKIDLACNKGCSYCCHYHVYISAPEAFALAEFTLNKMSELDRASVVSTLHRNSKLISGISLNEHMSTNIRCAYLSDAGRCIAYSVRPAACRRHHSVEGIACKVTFDDPSSSIKDGKVKELMDLSDLSINANITAANDLGLDISSYELHGAVMEAIDNPSSIKRWRRGKVAFPGVRDRNPNSVQTAS